MVGTKASNKRLHRSGSVHVSEKSGSLSVLLILWERNGDAINGPPSEVRAHEETTIGAGFAASSVLNANEK